MFAIGCLAKFIRKKNNNIIMGNLNCHILGTEGRRKLKFGEVSFQICPNFLRETEQINFRPECRFKLLGGFCAASKLCLS